jgi:hypothetical protein
MIATELRRTALWAGVSLLLFLCGAADAQSPPGTTSCVSEQVGAFSDRVFVRCAASAGGITTFAAPTSDAAHAARILSILSTAHVAGRTLQLTYEPRDTTGPSFGCPQKDCRLLLGAWFGK